MLTPVELSPQEPPSDRMLIDALCIVFASNHYVLTSREAAIVHRAREIISHREQEVAHS